MNPPESKTLDPKNKDKSLHTFNSFPEVRVVEASAGSGKTYALAKRYIQLLLNPAKGGVNSNLQEDLSPIRTILALTFTNKAAFEMKERILAFLKAIALNKLPAPELDEMIAPIGINPEEAQKKAYAVMEDLIRHYNCFQVQTIDKFINALLSGCAFKIGLTANFRIRTDISEYLEYSLDDLIDQAPHNPAVAQSFQSFLHNYLYLENRTGWFPKDDILNIITTLFSQSNTYTYQFKTSSTTSEALQKNKAFILKDMRNLKDQLPVECDQRFVKALDAFLDKHTHSFDIDSISDYFARAVPPVKKSVSIDAKLQRLWSKIRFDIQQLCEQEAFSLFNPYVEVLNLVKEGFYKRSMKDDILFLAELNKRARHLFDEDYVTVAELYYRLAARFRHYLVDEFQDTSRLQWSNLHTMSEEALSTGGSLFYVGDRKQAIYAFRGGDVALFDEVKNYFASFNVQNEYLTNNWRSQKEVVTFNNTVFSSGNLNSFVEKKQEYEEKKKKKNRVPFDEESLKGLESLFGSSTQSYQAEKDQGYVRVEYLDIDKKEERDELTRERLLQIIKECESRFSYRDIAVLTRNNTQVEDVTNWLLEAGVPVASERTSNVKEHELILELVDFLVFLNSPIDNLAFSRFILGNIFAKASGIDSQELHNFVFSLRERLRRENDFYVYMEFRKQYPQVWKNCIEEFFKTIGLFPFYELVVTIYHRLGVLDHFPEAQGFFMHFLELVKNKEEEHADGESFLKYFENLEGEDQYVRITDSDAVKVLTVHKSKGLEFPVVILPYLGMDIQVGSTAGDQKQSYLLQEAGDEMELVRLKNKYLSFSENLYAMHSKEYIKSFFGELNTVYVALTRAQCENYILIPKRVGNHFNIVRFLIPEEMTEQGTQVSYQATKTEEKQYQKVGQSQYEDLLVFLKDEFLTFEELKYKEQRQKGDVFHFLLSLLGNLRGCDVSSVIKEAITQAQYRFPYLESFDSFEKQITKMVKEPKLKPFFFLDSDTQVFNEKEVVNTFGDSKRIDRLMIKPREVWIVDYKSSQEGKDEQLKQVRDYMHMMKNVYPQRDVKGFLIYLDSFSVETV